MIKKFKLLFLLFFITFSYTYPALSHANSLKAYQYDQKENLKQEASIFYEYDQFNRLTSKNYPNGRKVQFQYDSIGNCTQVIDNDKITCYEYDIFGNVSKIIFPNSQSIKYLYDAFGKLLKITYPDNTEVSYSYDLSDRLIQVKDFSGVTKYEYDERLNKLKKTTLPNGVSTEFTYNSSRRISDVIHRNKDRSLIEKYQYKYDSSGNRIQIDKITSKNSFTVFYSYDSLNRITHSKYSNGYFESFTYDKRGNRLCKKTPDETINYEYNKEGQLLKAGDIQFFYDDDGNLIKKTSPKNTSKYSYDADNLLISYKDNFNKVEFKYDAFGNRISKTVNGIKTEYVNDTSSPISQVILKKVQENYLNKEKTIKYTYGGSRINQSCNEKTQFYLYDSMGRNVSSLINFSGKILNSYEYDAFGNILSENSNIKNVYKFSSEQFDKETGLIYLRNRYYDPSIGRFITKDKKLGDLKNPQTLNKYVYVENNPINFIDPLGFASMSPEQKERVILHINYRCGWLGTRNGRACFFRIPRKRRLEVYW